MEQKVFTSLEEGVNFDTTKGFQIVSAEYPKILKCKSGEDGIRKSILEIAAKACPTCAEEVLLREGLEPIE